MRDPVRIQIPLRRTILTLVFCIPAVSAYVMSAPQSRDQKCGTAWTHLDSPPSAAAADIRSGARVMARPLLQTSRVSPMGNFRIHFDTTGTNEPALTDLNDQRLPGSASAYIDSLGKAFDKSWTKIVGELGYAAPPPDAAGGDGLYDIYVMSLAPTLFGETQFANVPFQTVPNNRFETWILIDNDFTTQRTRGLNGATITAAHEFFHAVQIGSYGYWGSSEAYWYELTATWVEEQVFPEVNDYLHEVQRYMVSFRTTGFTEYTSIFPGYERVLFAQFISEQFGAASIRHVWEAMQTERVIPALMRTCDALGTSLQAVYSTFAVWNFYTADRVDTNLSYRDGSMYPRLEPLVQAALVGEETSLSYGFEPLSHGLFAIRLDADTLFVLLTNIDVSGATEPDGFDPAPEITLSRGAQTRPSQQLTLGVTGGLVTRDPNDWDIEYFSSRTRAVVPRTHISPFPNPWSLSTPFDLILPTSAQPGNMVSVFLVSADFRSISLGLFRVGTEKGSPAVRISGAPIREQVASGTYIAVVNTADTEELNKIVIIK